MVGGWTLQELEPAGRVAGAMTPGVAAEEREIVGGRIKWFDVVKGYGFMVPDEPGSDVLVHYNLLQRHGRKSLPEGARVVAEVRMGSRGRQAVEILSVDLSEAAPAIALRRELPAEPRIDPTAFLEAAGDYEPVHVRWFNRTRGYGFLLRSDGVTQVFVHMETVRRGGFETLVPGETLLARVHDGPKGALAVAVRSA
jgi:CspA family cold shock protein